MANSKISALTSSTTPLAGTEVLPIVQSSTTKQVSVANLTAGRTVNATALGVGVTTPATGITIEARNAAAGTGIRASNSGGGYIEIACESNATSNTQLNYTNQLTAAGGDFRLSGANFIPTTAAKGINFTANTPAAGMTSQLLNWYEEGTWTPTFTNLTVVGTPTYTGKYTRIGRMVSFTLRIQSTTSTSSSAGATYFNQPIAQFSNRGTLTAANGNATASYGVGLIANDGNCYLPTWVAIADVSVSGFYFV